METVHRILNIYKENEIAANEFITRKNLMDEIKSWGIDVSLIRDAWHILIGNGLIRQMGEEIYLTEKGASLFKDI